MRKTDIGNAIDSLGDDIRRHVLALVAQYRNADFLLVHRVAALKQAVDTPKRAQTQLAAWLAGYNAKNGAGTAQTFLASCLTAAGSSKTLAQVNADLAALVSQSQTLVAHVQNDAWTWDQVASAIEGQLSVPADAEFDYSRLPIPANYTTVWGEPW